MAGAALITGVPIPSRSTPAALVSSGLVGVHSNVVRPTAGYESISWRINAGSPTISLVASGYGLSTVGLQSSSFANGSTLIMSGSIPLADAI